MEYLHSLILGIVQGLTEFLPVSSSGHLVIFQTLFNLGEEGSHMAFDILLHLGTLAAVIVAFRRDIWELIKAFFAMMGALFTGKFKWKQAPGPQKLIIFMILACLPLVLVVPFKDKLEMLYAFPAVVGGLLIVNGFILLMADRLTAGSKDENDAHVRDSFIVGLFQAAAVVPGISRSGSTIVGGLISGFSREYAVKFSFLLSIPAIVGANIFSIGDVIAEGAGALSVGPALLGMAAAAVSGFAAIRLLQWLMKQKKFRIFAYYCMIAGAAVLVASLLQ